MKKTSKFLLVVACMLTSLGVSAMSASCGAYEMTGFIVESTTVQKEYTVGDVVDFDDVKMYTTWTDSTTQELTMDSGKVKIYLDGVEITGDLSKITKAPGTYTLGFKFSDELKEFEIVVKAAPKPAVLQSISIDHTNVKKNYNKGEAVTLEGLVVTAHYDDDTTKTIALNDAKLTIKCSGVDVTGNLNKITEMVGVKEISKQIEVKYDNIVCKDFFMVEIFDPNFVEQLTVSGTTSFTCAYGATSVDLTGLVVEEVLAGGGKTPVTNYQIDYANYLNTVGTHSVPVSYNGKTAAITITVYDVLEELEIVGGIPQNLIQGSAVNLTGLQVDGIYASGEEMRLDLLDEFDAFLLQQVVFELKDGENWTVITTDLNAITQVHGTQTVRLTFTDEKNTTASVEFTVEVGEPLPEVSAYSAPLAYINYKDRVQNATNDETAINFESSYYQKDNTDYLVGDDNAFQFLPVLTQVNFELGNSLPLSSFNATSTIWMMVENNYVELSKTKVGDTFEYSYNGTKYVTENYGKNTYDFNETAIGNKFKLSVLPDANNFDYEPETVDAAVAEFKVVDGYNITKPEELCLLEQTSEAVNEGDRRTDWDEIKNTLGLKGVRPSAVIFHNDLHVTTKSIPKTLYYTLPDDYNIKYKYTDETGEHVVSPEEVPESMGGPLTRDFLWNQYNGNYGMFEYFLKPGETFSIHGNYFDLNASKMPYVASFEPESSKVQKVGEGGDSLYYGDDFSNTSLLEIFGVDSTVGDADEHFYFSNFAVKGNAMNKELLTDGSTNSSGVACADKPVYPGGLIFLKMGHLVGDLDNVRSIHSFIAYFPDKYSTINLNNCKAYDNSQNAMYIWGQAVVNVTNSNMKRAGGPLIIMNYKDETDGPDLIPQLHIDANSVMESLVTGQEQWFATLGATPQITALQGLDTALRQFTQGVSNALTGGQAVVTKSILKDGKFNVVVAFLGNGGMESVTNVYNQGYVSYGNAVMDRLPDSAMFAGMLNHMGADRTYVMNLGEHILACDGSAFFNYAGNDFVSSALGGDTTTGAAAQAFVGNEYKHLTLNMGGLGLVLGYDNV